MEQTSAKQRTNPFYFSLELGFFAGLFWGGIRWIFYVLHFSVISPGFAAKPFFGTSFMRSASGFLLGWLFFILLSIAASLIYTALFRKLKGPWPGIAYGVIWWLLLFLIAGPQVGMMERLSHLPWNTIICEFCLFILWGVFIGYTVATEFNEERIRDEQQTVS
ncbi:YqhR family membrane protein [Paenibacillus sediminis]|nr:YqhR family membrane protein [Paenibacillus sediminis]